MKRRRRSSAEKKKMKTLTVILLAVGVFDLTFITAMIVIFCIKGFVPDVLIQCVLGASGVEAFFTAAIQIIKIIFEKGNDNERDYSEIDQ